MKSMPLFSLGAYQNLLEALRESRYSLLPVTSMVKSQGTRATFLRHDIDFSLQCALPMAELEANLGIRATYYVLLDGPYSLLKQGGQEISRLVELGHEIGLHYDMRNYPENPEDQRSQLKAEVAQLTSLCGKPVQTITMHEPHRGHGDPFREDEWVHPHCPAWFDGIHYISDSCRGWRDDSLLQFIHPGGPERLLLLTHPELWLNGDIEDRMDYLTQELIPKMPQESLSYFQKEVPAIWKRHIGAASHDLRMALEKKSCEVRFIDEPWTKSHLVSIQSLFNQSRFLPWGEKEILLDVPGKWEDSIALIQDGRVLGISFNSIREGRTYIHAIITHPEQRGEGYGSLLLRFLQVNAQKKGRAGIQLCVSYENSIAKSWYEQHGFKVVQNDPEQSQEILRWEQS